MQTLYKIFGHRFLSIAIAVSLLLLSKGIQADDSDNKNQPTAQIADDLETPIRIEADDKPIDIGLLSKYAHAGPWIADVDNDGDRDLLVGDFPGYFWFFENTGNDNKPVYSCKGKLDAGDKSAKTPIY